MAKYKYNVSVVLDKEMFDVVTKVAERDKVSKGQVVRDCLEMALEAREFVTRNGLPKVEVPKDDLSS